MKVRIGTAVEKHALTFLMDKMFDSCFYDFYKPTFIDKKERRKPGRERKPPVIAAANEEASDSGNADDEEGNL